MYSDDLWNLVYVKKSLNSSMSNKTKNNAIKKKLINRNKQLLEKLIQNNVSNKIVDELKLSIEKDYVEQFWISALG
jgi:FixJ family two-component response regulator